MFLAKAAKLLTGAEPESVPATIDVQKGAPKSDATAETAGTGGTAFSSGSLPSSQPGAPLDLGSDEYWDQHNSDLHA